MYQDRFFTEEFAYFEFFRWMEAAVHVPVSLWAVGALLRGEPASFSVGDSGGRGDIGACVIGEEVDLAKWWARLIPRFSGDYKIPAVLLAYAIQTSVTTATCIYDYSFWTQIDATAKWHLTSLYGPYLLLCE